MGRELLLQALKERQGTARQDEFAARLGISQGYWSHLCRGKRPLSDKIIRRTRRVFPDLEGLCIAALLVPEPEVAA